MQPVRAVSLILVVGWMLCARACALAEPADQALAVTISPDQILASEFLGFGVEWEYEGDHPELNLDNPVWQGHWPEMLERIDFMRPSIVRVMHTAPMYTRLDDGRVVADYDSPRMQVMYRLLDYARDRDIPVVLGEWLLPQPYVEPLGGVGGPRWSGEVIVPFLVHLLQAKGYGNIRWFNLINEPTDYDIWKSAITNLHEALTRQGLDRALAIVGTDGPGDFSGWIERVAKDAGLRDRIGAYEYHIYAHLKTDKWLPSLLEGKLETDELLLRRRIVSAEDPRGAGKPFFMGEAGIADGNAGDNQTNRAGFRYGVWMADYAIQSMRAGLAGLIAWDMDDAMHTWGSYGGLGLKGWGFWNSLAGFGGYSENDFELRPWFYTWSLLCRLFPRGSQTLAATSTGDPSCRVAAARLPQGRGLSFAVVNEADAARTIVLRMPGTSPANLYEYRYFEVARTADERGCPRVSRVRLSADLEAGVKILLPASGVVFLTNDDPAQGSPAGR